MELSAFRDMVFCFVSALAMAMLASPGITVADESDEFANGPLQEQPDRMRELIRWTLNGPKLAIRKDWQSNVSVQERQKEFDTTVDKMVERGFDEATARRLAEQTLKNRMSDEPFGAAFMQLARGNSGQGRSSSGDLTEYHFHGRDLRANAEREADQLRISFIERNGPRREWTITDLGDGRLTFRYSGDDFLTQIKQKSDGSIGIIRIRGTAVESLVGDNFASLRRQNPALVEKWLMPLFEHLGFSLPLSNTNPAIRQAVIARLKVSDGFDAGSFGKLIADLNSDDFAARDTATESLRAQRELYREAIVRELDRSELTLEVRTRLNRILQNDAGENEVDRFVREQNLVNSPEYLVSLFTPEDAQLNQLICRQLERITGEALTQSQALKRWASPDGQGDTAVDR